MSVPTSVCVCIWGDGGGAERTILGGRPLGATSGKQDERAGDETTTRNRGVRRRAARVHVGQGLRHSPAVRRRTQHEDTRTMASHIRFWQSAPQGAQGCDAEFWHLALHMQAGCATRSPPPLCSGVPGALWEMLRNRSIGTRKIRHLAGRRLVEHPCWNHVENKMALIATSLGISLASWAKDGPDAGTSAKRIGCASPRTRD